MNKRLVFVLILVIVIVISIVFLLSKYNIYKLDKSESNIEDIDWSGYNSSLVTLSDNLEITEEGVYFLSGAIANGYIHINTEDNVKLVLDGVSISCEYGPAIYIEKAKNVEISTVKNTTSTLADGSMYEGYPDDVNATIYSKDDLILSGDGTLRINANYEDGIVSKDKLYVTDGVYNINARDDALNGKDAIIINDGVFNIRAKGDGIVTTNEEDSDSGYIIIKDGVFNIKTDGVDDKSRKGIKAINYIKIDNGVFNITTEDDSIHANGNITIHDGVFNLDSSDDAIHADAMVYIEEGVLKIKAHEGIEATYVKIADGVITIDATDDGINAGNKSDKYSVMVEINGGEITINMGPGDTDGIDSNGDLYIKGGIISINAESPFDYDGEAKYKGGIIIVNGKTTNKITNQMMGMPGSHDKKERKK